MPTPTMTPTETVNVTETWTGFDGKTVTDTTTYTRLDTSARIFAGTPYSLRFQADRDLTPAEARNLAALVGYTYAATIAGERLGEPHQDTPRSITLYADTTKSRRDDLGMAFEQFEDMLPDVIRDGSPVRKTDRSGPGTKGTRLVQGLGDLTVTIWADDVFVC